MHTAEHQLGQLAFARRQGRRHEEAVLQGCCCIHPVICATIIHSKPRIIFTAETLPS